MNMNKQRQLTETLKPSLDGKQHPGMIHLLFENKTLKNLQNCSFKLASDLNQKVFRSKPFLNAHPPLMLGIAAFSLTGLVGYRFYNQPQLTVGTESPYTIIAPRTDQFEDPKTTESKRKAVETNIIPILKRDPTKTIELRVTVTQTLDQIQQFRQQAGSFPFLDETLLSTEAQRYLRTCPEEKWQAILKKINPSQASSATKEINKTLSSQITEKINQTSDTKKIIDKIRQSRQQYQKFKDVLPMSTVYHLDEPDILALINLTDSQWQNTQQATLEAVHRMLTQGLYAGLPPSLLLEIIDSQLHQQLPKPVEAIIKELLLKVLANESNLVKDEQATHLVAQQASEAIEPVFVEISQGEVIVEAGETVSQEAFVLLDGFQLSQRQINGTGLGISGLLVIGGIGAFCWVARRVNADLRRRDHILLWLLSTSTPILAIINQSYLNLPMIGVLTSSFYSPALAITQVIALGGVSAFAIEDPQWDYLLAGTASGLLAAAIAGRLRSRDELAFLGVGTGITQGGVYFLYHILLNAVTGGSGIFWYFLLPKAIVCGVSGMVWTVLAIGLSPYLERFFDLVTPIRLVELANPNCTLLKRLATETPGTFQHTLFVSCLAEAAARELNCNVELIRAGTLYHDIGKMHDPLGFIENQMGGPNKHDEIDDPWVSTEIIKKHVSEGLVMAKQYGLPKKIQDFIPEHQGQLLISYFYFQAKQQAEQEKIAPVLEDDFRYAGPIPQCRETGIVMLADGCEAALRSMREGTPEAASALIKKIFKARWRDGQLKDSGITFEELPIIADVFTKVWQQFHHKRIAYPNIK